jgi:hypothetical protein
MLRAMVLGWLGGLFTPIHERVLYPSHHPGGGLFAPFLAHRRSRVRLYGQNRSLPIKCSDFGTLWAKPPEPLKDPGPLAVIVRIIAATAIEKGRADKGNVG